MILYDTFGQVQGDGVDLEDLVNGGDAKVVIFSWNIQPELVERAIARGAAGYLSKGLTAEEIVAGDRGGARGRDRHPAGERAAPSDASRASGRAATTG